MKFHFKTMHHYELYFHVKFSIFLESLDPCAFLYTRKFKDYGPLPYNAPHEFIHWAIGRYIKHE